LSASAPDQPRVSVPGGVAALYASVADEEASGPPRLGTLSSQHQTPTQVPFGSSPTQHIENSRGQERRALHGGARSSTCKDGGNSQDLNRQDSSGSLKQEDMRHLKEVLSDAGLWSSGSSRHARGLCRPCHYVRSQRGCTKGADCDFCHFPHTGKTRRQLGMSSRLYCKYFAENLNSAYSGRAEELKRVFEVSSTGSTYLLSLMQSTGQNDSQPARSSTPCKEEEEKVEEEAHIGSSALASIMRDHYQPEGWWSF